MSSATAFLVFSDGSQPGYVEDGTPVQYAVELHNIDKFGDATAKHLNRLIDVIFSKEHHINGLVSSTSNGVYSTPSLIRWVLGVHKLP